MSGGLEEARAMGTLSLKLRDAAYELREAAESAKTGYRGVGIDGAHEVNAILLPSGWKLVRAEKVEIYR